MHSRSGQIINAPDEANSTASGNIIDSNGNTVTNNGNGSFTDTLGVTALTIGGAGSAASPLTLTYPVALQANSSTSATVTISYRTYTVQTNFQCSGISEYGANSVDLIDHITLPDASASTYSFSYEATAGVTGAVTGRLTSITLPTGGTISYSYTQGGCNGSSGINPDGTPGSMTRATGDGTRTYTRSVNTNATNTTVQDEKGNQSVYQFTIANGLFFETERSIYQGPASGTALFDQTTCYNFAVSPCNGSLISLPISETMTFASNNGGSQLGTQNVYDALGGLTSSTQNSGSTPTLQITTNSYNSLEELLKTTTTDGSGNVVASASYGYDETTPTATSGIPQHNAVSGTRGNQTSVQVSTGSGTLATTTAYYDTGVPVSTTTPNGTTGYSYDATQTFVTQTTLPTPSSGVALATSASYDQQSGVQISATGMNAGQTTQVAQYDPLLRATSVTLPNGGVVTTTYSGNDTIVDQTTGTGSDAVTHTLVDTYGRKSRVAVLNGQSSNPWYQVDYCYDATGLLQFQSMRYQGSGFSGANATKQCSGAGTTYSYDALGRMTSSTNADGTTSWQYNGRAVETTDVNGVQRITQHDLLGRISAICEISSNTLQGDTPGPCGMDIAGSGFLTTYAYNLATHTTTITQGAQTRVFQTDAAGRTIYTSEPERGVTTYSYTYSATSPCAGVGLCVTRTRPQANQTNPSVVTTTTTQYDSLGRPLTVTYSDGTPKRNYTYDAPVQWPIISQQNVKGMLSMAFSSVAFSSEGTVYSYNAMGQIIGMGKCQPSGCSNRAFDKLLSYSYDLLGNVTSSSDGGGVTTSYQYSPASEVQSITSSLNDANHPSALVSNVQNGPYGPTSYQMGNGVTSVFAHDTLGRLNGGFACTGSAQAGCTGGAQLYGYSVAWQGSRLQSSADTVQNYQATYGYDEFNRLTGLNVTSGSASSYSYLYDRYGNRWQQNPSGSGSGPAPNLSFDKTSNRILMSGFSYDAAGNLLSDSLNNTYQYDAEGNMIGSSSGLQLSYDSFNEQILSNSTDFSVETEVVFDQWGKTASLWKVNTYNSVQGNSELAATAYWGSTPIEAYLPGSSTSHFRYRDWVGSLRMETDASGNVTGTRVGLPFGDATSNSSGSRDGSFDGFAGYWDGTTSTTNHAPFREYSNLTGRWMSPDPYDGSYRMGNPQSFNRYNYVVNNPLGYVDPNGLSCINVLLSDGSTAVADNGDGYGCDSLSTTVNVYSGNDVLQPTPVSSTGTIHGSAPNNGRQCIANCGKPAPPRLPSCWAVGAQAVVNSIGGTFDPSPSVSGAITDLSSGALTIASYQATIKAELYAATRINARGGIGLIKPGSSSTYRALTADAAELGEAAQGAFLLGFDFNLISQWKAEWNTPCR